MLTTLIKLYASQTPTWMADLFPLLPCLTGARRGFCFAEGNCKNKVSERVLNCLHLIVLALCICLIWISARRQNCWGFYLRSYVVTSEMFGSTVGWLSVEKEYLPYLKKKKSKNKWFLYFVYYQLSDNDLIYWCN